MKINEYVNLIRETKIKNNIEWNDTIATLAIYKYLKSPAISDYYKNIQLYRNTDGSPVICNVDKSMYTSISARLGILRSKDTGSEAENFSFHIDSKKFKQIEKLEFSSNKLRDQLIQLREKLLSSDSFDNFCENFSTFKKDKILDSSIDFKIKKFLNLASFIDKSKTVEADDCNYKSIVMVLSLLDDTHKLSNNRHQTIIKPILNIIENNDNLSKDTIFDGMYMLANYDNIESDNYHFDIRSADEKISYYQALAKMPDIKDNTVFGIVMNNTENIINKLIENFIFDELKSLALIQTKLAIKEQTLEDLFESNPIIDEIYQEAVKQYPMIESPMHERFKHLHIIDETFDVGEKRRVSFSSLMDGLELYGNEDKHHYLTIQPKILSYPHGRTTIMNDQPFERFYGHDGVGPYYVAFARNSDFATSTNALIFDNFFISEQLDDYQVKELFENIFQNCMTRNLVCILTDTNFKNVIGERNFQNFIEVRELYKDSVPIITDISKYKIMNNFDLTYDEIFKVEERFKLLPFKEDRLKDYYDCIHDFKNENNIEKKSAPKL